MIFVIQDLIIVFFLAVTLAIALTGFLHIVVYRVPFVRTQKSVAREMVRLADLRGSECVYDLGAGDGRILFIAKEEHPDIIARGCEVVPTVWLFAQVQRLRKNRDVQIYLRNALHQSVADADVIFLYLLPHLMGRLESKFDAELRPGTKVVSHGFRFPGRAPEKEVKMAWKGRWKKLYLYQW